MLIRHKSFHIVGLIASLSMLWLLLSGHYTPLLLTLGLLSVSLVAFISLRMKLIEYDQPEVLQQVLHGIPYSLWLLKEIFKSNIDVCKRILNPALPISPCLVWIKSTQREELAKVVYANSITLTPGTISIDVEEDQIEVHSLTAEGAEDLVAGEMDRQISQAELKAHV